MIYILDKMPALRDMLLLLFVFLIVITIIPFGSVTLIPFSFAAIGMFVLAVIGGLVYGEPQHVKPAFRVGLALLVILAAWTFTQTISLPNNWLENSAWQSVRQVIGSQPGAISVEPADTRSAILFIALPFMTFLTGLCLCDNDERAQWLIKAMGVTSGLIAIFGLLQFAASPSTLIAVRKVAYLDSLTAVFVNRNTAATFFGVGLLTLAILVHTSVKSAAAYPIGSSGRTTKLVFVGFYAVLLCSCFTALMLSRSRAGITSTFAATFILVMWIAASNRAGGLAASMLGRVPSAVRIVVAGALLILVFIAFSGQAILRARERELLDDDRLCILPGIWRAVSDYWLTGTGLGTFRTVFSSYRDPACGIFGVFDRAHNFYLEAFLGLGIVFLVTLIVALVVLLAIFLRGLKHRRRGRAFVVLGICATILVLLHGTVDFSLQIPGFAIFFAALLSATVSISLGRRSPRPDNPQRQYPTGTMLTPEW